MILKDDDILVHTDGFWDEPQRIRHKMPLAWSREGNRVLWVEQPPFPPHDWRVPGRLSAALTGRPRAVGERIWAQAAPPAVPKLHAGGRGAHLLRTLHTPLMLRRIRKGLAELRMRPRLFFLFQQPARYGLFDSIEAELNVYYCHDLYGYGGGTEAMFRDEGTCCARADAVFTTARVVADRLSEFQRHTYHLPHAVDLDGWDRAPTQVPEDLDRIPQPRALFAGAIGEKLDFRLLDELASRIPELQIVLLGQQTGPRSALENILKKPNVHHLGEKPADVLPAYYRHAQLLLFPYTMTDARSAIGLPLKFYEYCLAGPAILATPFTTFETDHADLITIARTAEEWTLRIRNILDHPEIEAPTRAERIALARRNTYEARTTFQRQILEQVLAEKRAISRSG